MKRLRSRRFVGRSSSRGSGSTGIGVAGSGSSAGANEIKWELRPGGMLVQRRESGGGDCITGEGMITVRVSAVSLSHDISIGATSTFGELKMVVSMVTGWEPEEQRILFRGKEREEGERLHMVGVGDGDKVLLLQDPAMKDRKLRGLDGSSRPINANQTCYSY